MRTAQEARNSTDPIVHLQQSNVSELPIVEAIGRVCADYSKEFRNIF